MATGLTVALALLLVGSLLAATLGPPPPWHVAIGVRSGLLAAGIAGYALAALALATDAVVVGAVTLAFASELVCVAGWLSRSDAPPADDDDDEGGGGGGGRGPKQPPPVDWDAFERAFGRYARERDRQPT